MFSSMCEMSELRIIYLVLLAVYNEYVCVCVSVDNCHCRFNSILNS